MITIIMVAEAKFHSCSVSWETVAAIGECGGGATGLVRSRALVVFRVRSAESGRCFSNCQIEDGRSSRLTGQALCPPIDRSTQ
jgi:hypothetical protein